MILWKGPALAQHTEWKYRKEYSRDVLYSMLTEEEKEKQWIAYLDYWYKDCLENEHYYVR